MGLRGRARRGGGGGDPRQTKRLSPLHFGAPSDPAGRAGRGALAPPPPPPTAPSPTLTLQQPLDDAVDVELVYIRHRLSAAGRSLPRRSARGLAGPTRLLVLSRFCPFLLCAFPRALSSPPPPQHRASTEQNGRRPLSGLAWRTDTIRARRGSSETLYRPGGKSGGVMRLRLRDPSAAGTGSSAAVPPPGVATGTARRNRWWRSQNPRIH